MSGGSDMSAAPEGWTLSDFTEALVSRPAGGSTPYRVGLEEGELARLEEVCGTAGVDVIDTLDRQLEELARVRLPAGTEDERDRWIEHLLAEAGGPERYGSWFWYPWARSVVHVLEREDFFDVVTNRNQDKITRREQLRLREKRVGVMGLSVGAEIAVTVAQEHLCGHLVLADFDTLELSNLNRVGAGVADLGLNKAHLTARRIAAIDPYLAVTVYDEGITEQNAAAFLDGLDLLIEECDGLAMKHRIRELARERRIDLVYAADERGLLSIEPYRGHPELPLFHGLDVWTGRERGSAEGGPGLAALATWLGGLDRLSTRSRESLDRVGAELCGYPQLASEPRLAAGQVGHVARRLLLGERLEPYFGYYDLQDVLPA